MKKIFVSAIILCSSVFVFAQQDIKNMPSMNMPKQEKSQPVQPVIYTCPMHPEIHSPKPGNCPKCGMKLIKEKAKIPPAKKEIDTPILKDTVKQHEMGNMQMPARPSGGDTMPKVAPQTTIYNCVMHPEIQSSKPGNCPKCGMKLVKQKPKVVPEKKEEMNMPMPKDTTKKKDDMSDMKMDNMPKENDMGYKIIENNTPPRTVRYDLYITDTIVNFAGTTLGFCFTSFIPHLGQLPGLED